MIRKSKTAKFVAGFVGFALALSFVVTPVTAKADTTSDLQAQIAALLAQITQLQAQISGGASTSSTFSTDLTLGSTGADVTALQQWLVSKGFLSMPAGVAMGYFGPLTQAAVTAYQTSKGISPASGYFGPITRASVNAMAPVVPPVVPPVTPPVGTGLQGGAGSVDTYKLVSGLTNEKVGEDEEDVKVAGLEIEADDGSDLQITAVKLVFNEGTAGSDFDKYATEVSLWFDGKEVGRVDASGFTDDNAWTKTVSLDGAVVDAAGTSELVVAVSGISNLDTNDATDTWTVDFRQVRFVDATGASTSEDPTVATRTFSFESFATASNAELKIVGDDEDVNDPHVIDVHASDDTNDIPVLSFTLEAEGDSDLLIDKVSASTTVTGASNVDDLVKEITLWIDGEEIASGSSIQDADGVTVGSTEGYLFDDLNYTLPAGETVNAEIRVSFNSVADDLDEGDTLLVEITESSTDDATGWDVEDESGERLGDSDITGTATGGADAVYDIGLNVSFVSASAETDGRAAGYSGGDDTGIYKITFDVTSFGDDVFIDADLLASSTADTVSPTAGTDGTSGFFWASTTSTTATTTIATGNPLAILECAGSEGSNSSAPDVTTAGQLSFGIPEGETRRCSVSVNIGPVTGSIQAGLRVRGLGWDTDSGDVHANIYTFNLGEFKTSTISLLNT